MTHQAKGSFEVKMIPQTDVDVGDPGIGRLALNKQFTGDLDAESRGQMLAVHGSADGSAGYVAMERVTGTLHGVGGSFALQHSGTMTRGAPQLVITVVPDSGTDGLEGIVGALTIHIVEGRHDYTFDYRLELDEENPLD
ncbi:MAG: DUF3224 domain-containing protein [Lysobacteraceae bacterium]